VHAFDIRVPILTAYEVAIPDSYVEPSRKAATEKLAGIVEKIEQTGVTVRSHLERAPSALAIVHLAERLGADLIVMGTRGNTGLNRGRD